MTKPPEHKTIVAIAQIHAGASYDYETHKDGLPGFWSGTVKLSGLDCGFKIRTKGRGYRRAIAFGLIEAGQALLALSPPEYPE